MGISDKFSLAFAKSQIAAGSVLPTSGRIFHQPVGPPQRCGRCNSVTNSDRSGFELLATSGTAERLKAGGVEVTTVKKIAEGHPNLIDYLKNDDVQLILNTPSGKGARTDEGRIRAAAVQHGVPCITTLAAAEAAVRAMKATREVELEVESLQSLYARS